MLIRRLILLCCLFIPVISQADTITLVADEWCPYNCAPDSSKPGFMVDVAKFALEKQGHRVVYKLMPWARAIEQARNGKIDGIIGAYKDDAPDFVFPSEPITYSRNDLFVKSGEPWKFSGLESLKSIAMGVVLDYAYGGELDSYIKANKDNASRIQAVAGDKALETNIKKLLAGRVGVIVEDDKVMAATMQKLGLEGKINKAGSFEGDDVYIGFAPNNPRSHDYAKILSNEIIQMQKTGKLKEILSSYGVR